MQTISRRKLAKYRKLPTPTAYLLHNGSASKWKQRAWAIRCRRNEVEYSSCFYLTRKKLSYPWAGRRGPNRALEDRTHACGKRRGWLVDRGERPCDLKGIRQCKWPCGWGNARRTSPPRSYSGPGTPAAGPLPSQPTGCSYFTMHFR